MSGFGVGGDEQEEQHAKTPLTTEPSCKDEARIGQKNKLTRRWARRGTRPRAPHDQRTAWAYIFGAICPAEGKGAGIVMPFCDTPAMQEHLLEISADSRAGRPRGSRPRPGRLASRRRARRAREHHAPAPAIALARAEPRRERLAVHARQLALEPGLQGLRRHRRPLLRRLERPRRSALAHPIHRKPGLGGKVLINAGWYYRPSLDQDHAREP